MHGALARPAIIAHNAVCTPATGSQWTTVDSEAECRTACSAYVGYNMRIQLALDTIQCACLNEDSCCATPQHHSFDYSGTIYQYNNDEPTIDLNCGLYGSAYSTTSVPHPMSIWWRKRFFVYMDAQTTNIVDLRTHLLPSDTYYTRHAFGPDNNYGYAFYTEWNNAPLSIQILFEHLSDALSVMDYATAADITTSKYIYMTVGYYQQYFQNVLGSSERTPQDDISCELTSDHYRELFTLPSSSPLWTTYVSCDEQCGTGWEYMTAPSLAPSFPSVNIADPSKMCRAQGGTSLFVRSRMCILEPCVERYASRNDSIYNITMEMQNDMIRAVIESFVENTNYTLEHVDNYLVERDGSAPFLAATAYYRRFILWQEQLYYEQEAFTVEYVPVYVNETHLRWTAHLYETLLTDNNTATEFGNSSCASVETTFAGPCVNGASTVITYYESQTSFNAGTKCTPPSITTTACTSAISWLEITQWRNSDIIATSVYAALIVLVIALNAIVYAFSRKYHYKS